MRSKGVKTERDTRLSKKLSRILRHAAVEEGISIKADGFAGVEEILRSKCEGYDREDVERIVRNDEKQRFALRLYEGVLEIRANQGHSIREISQLNLRLLENPSFDIIHGTYLRHWPEIKNRGLSRMKRNHIHFAKGLTSLRGIRASVQMYIYVNFKKASEAKLKFFEAQNGVVLCEGDINGILEPRYFLKVTLRNGEILWPESRDSI